MPVEPKDCKEVQLSSLYESFSLRKCDGFLFHKGAESRRFGARAGWLDKHSGYRQVRVNGRALFEHRVVWAMHHARWPDNYVDHVDGNRSNNCPDNLRDVTHYENMRRSLSRKGKRMSLDGREMSIGVSVDRGYFKVSRCHHGARHYGGRFKCLDEANSKAEELRKLLGLSV